MQGPALVFLVSIVAVRHLCRLGTFLMVVGSLQLHFATAESPTIPRVISAEPAPEWSAKFAGREGWTGGDEAYSAVLGENRVLWLFGDSLIGKASDEGRAGAAMVNNTVAVQTGLTADSAFKFIAGEAEDGKPAALLKPNEGPGWFWPQAAIQIEGRLYVFLARIDKSDDPGVFGFRQISQHLAVIDNPKDPPRSWSAKISRVPFVEFRPELKRCFGSALLLVDKHIYVYGYTETGSRLDRKRLLVARAPAAKLDDFTTWEFRRSDDWNKSPDDAVPQARGLAAELSVSPTPAGNGYLAVYTEHGIGDQIVGRFSDQPYGPWSDPVLLYKCPEMARDKGVFSYAAKAHAWADDQDSLLVSYCVNTWDFGRLFRDQAVYRPKFVRVKLRP